MDLSDLEKRLLDPPKEEKKAPTKPEPKKPKAKKEEPKPVPAPAPTPAPEPVKGKKAAKYDLGGVETKPKKEAPAPAPKVEKPKVVKPAPKPVAPKAPPAPKVPATKDPNAVPAGVALGGAPLLLAPVALLGAGRGILSGTKARREKIQAEIAAFEAAQKKKKVQAEVDGSGVATALVSRWKNLVNVLCAWHTIFRPT